MSAIAIDQRERAAAPAVEPEIPSFVAEHTPRLSTVAPNARPRKRPLRYAITAIVGIALIGVAQVSIALVTTQESFVLADRMSAENELVWQQQALESEVVRLGSPQELAQKASGQGLVVNGSPHYLRLSDGAVIGSTDPATGLSVIAPRNASVANALIDTPDALPDQAAWDAVFAAGVKPASAAVIASPEIRQPAPIVTPPTQTPEVAPVAEAQAEPAVATGDEGAVAEAAVPVAEPAPGE